MNSLSEALRASARAALPPGAFLRRDRGDTLFVTNAPRLRPDVDWAGALARAGFDCASRGGLTVLRPGAAWLQRLEAGHPTPPDTFCAGFARFAGLAPEPESLRLFALGARILDGEPDDGRFERDLRRRAAVCLRLSASPSNLRGGGLYACALLDHELEV